MNTYTFPILRLMADGKFHSGEVIARHLNVTRTTVWQALQYAARIGVTVYSVPGRGYKLPTPLMLLDELAISQAIGEQRAWFKLVVLDEVDSTNSYLMQQLNQSKDSNGLTHLAAHMLAKATAHATCVAAQVQTNGRGRRGRSWQAGLGASLTFSVLWRFQCGASGLSGLSLAVGVALIRALHGLGVTSAQLKWPNDVLVFDAHGQAKKLAGILIELQGDMDGQSAAVIGVGVNLNLSESLRDAIDQPVVDLHELTTQSANPLPINPNELLGNLLKNLADVLSDFERDGFGSVRDEWTHYHAYEAKPVRLLVPDGREVQGFVRGVADDGILLVETSAGLQRFSSAEISLRGLQ